MKSDQGTMFQIKNRWTGSVIFEADVDANLPFGARLRAAVKIAYGRGAVLSGADLRDADLRDAVLRDADLRGADLRGAVLSGADLSGAVLRGADLRGADLRGAVLSGADLRDADLRDAVLRDADLSGAVLRGADLRGAVLRGAVLSGAVLRGADLSGADLRGADLRDADWIPRVKNIHQAVYEAASAENALNMGNWHTCETTHCRAGWVVVLAGPAGRTMEDLIGPAAAAALIYQASDPGLERIPNFYASNADALADMKRLAEAEAAKIPA